ncbi:MAG: TonB-dependent receptor [Helicobacteraceae bacterium]|jgi:iron complex outermembrane receptor protein|nr:TonB-dependent receptor [Helicobacteraceae bacterium]
MKTGAFSIALALAIASNAFGEETVNSDRETANSVENAANSVGEAVDLGEMTIKAEQESIGGVSGGYLDKETKIGALGGKKAIDVPYQINVIPQEIIKNQRSRGLEDVVKYAPSAQIEYRGGGEMGRPQTRGMRGDVVANTYWDGFNVVSTTATPMAQFDNLQIHNGLAGAFYGAQNPSGVYNFTLKRPTKSFENSAILTYAQNANAQADLDLGGTPASWIGYRANLVYGDGEGYVKDSKLERKLAAIGLDFYPLEGLKIETNAIYYDYIKEGYAAAFSMPIAPSTGKSQFDLPNAYDASKKKYSVKDRGMEAETTTGSAKIKYDASAWSFEAGYLKQRADRFQYQGSHTFSASGFNTAAGNPKSEAGRFEIGSYLAHIATKQELGFSKHEIAAGLRGYKWEMFSTPTAAQSRYKSGYTKVDTISIVDYVTFSEKWATLLSIGVSDIQTKSLNAKGKTTASNSDDGTSYSASVIFHPNEVSLVYFGFSDSLMAGASGAHADGNTTTLKPHRSVQYEIGAKYGFDYFDLSAALFQIERPIAYLGNNGRFEEQGDQINKGVEFMASGKVTDNLSLFGGATYMKTALNDTKIAKNSGNEVIGMPSLRGNVLVEYAIPNLEALFISGNLNYTGKIAIDQANDEYIKARYTIDLAARYISKDLIGDSTVFRMSINNLTNEKYWASAFNNNGLDGLVQGGTSLFLGEPRTITASMEVRF